MKNLLITLFIISFSCSAFSDFNWKLMEETKNGDKFKINRFSIISGRFTFLGRGTFYNIPLMQCNVNPSLRITADHPH